MIPWYATSIVVIYLKLNLPTSMHLFTFVFFRPSKVNTAQLKLGDQVGKVNCDRIFTIQ